MKREKKYTKGRFKDGTIGWKIRHLGKHFNNPEIERIEIIWSDDEECICDTVYEESDAKLISAAPDLLEALEALQEQYIEICNNVGLSHIIDETWAFQKAEKAIAKAYGEKE